MSVQVPLEQIMKALRGRRFPFEDEKHCQNTIEQALRQCLPNIEREVPATGGIIDFMAGAIGIEVKLKGNARAIMRQVRRYAEDTRIAAIVLATSRPVGIEREINGKPVVEFNLGEAWL